MASTCMGGFCSPVWRRPRHAWAAFAALCGDSLGGECWRVGFDECASRNQLPLNQQLDSRSSAPRAHPQCTDESQKLARCALNLQMCRDAPSAQHSSKGSAPVVLVVYRHFVDSSSMVVSIPPCTMHRLSSFTDCAS